MTIPFSIVFGDEAPQRYELEEAEHAALVAFVALADTLRGVECVRQNRVVSISLSVADATMQLTPLPDTELDQLLMKLRPFIHDKERTFFPKIAKLLARRVPDPRFRAFVAAAREQYFDHGRRDRFRVFVTREEPTALLPPESPVPVAGAVALDSDATLKQWLYGFKYHFDPDLQAELLDVLGAIDPTVVSVAILPNLARKVAAICGFADAIRELAKPRPPSSAPVAS